MFCRECGNENVESAHFCGSCGTKIEQNKQSPNRKWLISGILFSLLCIAGISYLFIQVWPKTEIQVIEKETTVAPKEILFTTPEKNEVIKPIPIVINEKDKTMVIKESMPKVFTIFTEDGFGSGFLYKKGGFIITNAHVVVGYTNVVVRNSNGKDTPGKVIGISDKYDIALISALDYVHIDPLQTELKESEVGTEVIAIGSPQGFENTASIGYLTGIGRNIEYGFTYDNTYQIDALIDQGSSGGPLIDAKSGKVIGINSLLYTKNVGIGFSIPMYSVLDLVNSWAETPMTEQQVHGKFDVYDDYSYFEDDYNNKDFDDKYVEEFELDIMYDEYSLEYFILNYRDSYELALEFEEYYWIEDMILPNSTAYFELLDYIKEISNKGMTFEFIENTVLDISYQGDYAIVSTFEVFEFISASGEYSLHERTKEYTVVYDDNGFYRISEIYIYE